MSTQRFIGRWWSACRRPARDRRRRSVCSLNFEACETRRVLSASMLVQLPAPDAGALAAARNAQTAQLPSLWQFAQVGSAQAAVDPTVAGSVAEGRLVTGSRVYGFSKPAGTDAFDVGFAVTGVTEGSKVSFEILQGVTFWNGRGNPRFAVSPQPVELNFGHDTADVRIGSRRNVGSLLGIGTATSGPQDPVASGQFTVTGGVGGSGSSFIKQAANGIYAIVGRLVGEGAPVESSAPVTFVFSVGNVASTALESAVAFFRDRPAVSVFGAQTPAPGVYGVGKELRVALQVSDPVTVTGAPRMPLTIVTPVNRQQRMAVLDRNVSSPTRLVFRYVVQPNDGFNPRFGTFQAAVQPTTGRLQLPPGSAIRGTTGGVVFPQAMAPLAFSNVSLGSPRVLRVETNTPAGDYRAGAVLWFGLEMSEPANGDTVAGTPTIPIRAIGGTVIGQADYVPDNFPPFESSYLLFRFTVPAGVSARQGVIVSGPISLNGGKIIDRWGNDAVLTFAPLIAPGVRVLPA